MKRTVEKTVDTAAYVGSIPAVYDRYLGPMLLEPFATGLLARLAAEPMQAVHEVAA